MRTHIIRREENKELIILYGGWGIDQNAFIPLCTRDHDFILYYNYSANEPLVLPDRKTYEKIIVIGWSLGVWATEYFSESMQLCPDLTIAVNGTPVPADDRYGIPLEIYDKTLQNIEGTGIEDFNIKVYGSREIMDQNTEKFSKRSKESYEAELRWLYNRMMENRDRNFRWDIAISSAENPVFPSENQINYWKKRESTRHLILDLPHYPFHHWGTFNNMIDDILGKTGLDLTYR